MGFWGHYTIIIIRSPPPPNSIGDDYGRCNTVIGHGNQDAMGTAEQAGKKQKKRKVPAACLRKFKKKTLIVSTMWV